MTEIRPARQNSVARVTSHLGIPFGLVIDVA